MKNFLKQQKDKALTRAYMLMVFLGTLAVAFILYALFGSLGLMLCLVAFALYKYGGDFVLEGLLIGAGIALAFYLFA